jgi:hypothetical protein
MNALFRNQLQSSADGFIWSIGQIPEGRYHVLPLPAFGAWPVLRIVFHQVWVERHIMLPYMRWWAGDPSEPDFGNYADDQEDQDWKQTHQNVDALLAAFRSGRDEQINLVERTPQDSWDDVRQTVFGEVPLRWLLTKTYQSTLQQTSQLLEMALYWDLYLIDHKNKRLKEGREKDNQW